MDRRSVSSQANRPAIAAPEIRVVVHSGRRDAAVPLFVFGVAYEPGTRSPANWAGERLPGS
jgi:hypothetical protein